MVGSTAHQPSLFYVAFAQQASLIKDDLLAPIDALLDDPALVELVRTALARRAARSTCTGRTGIAPDRLLRCCALRHLKQWSLRELERELRGSLVYRRFTRFDHEPTPDYSTFSRTFALLGPQVTREIHRRVVARARQDRIAPGRKLRTDTTVVETNIHYPTDSALLGDGIRVLTRALRRVATECQSRSVPVIDHTRATRHRLLEISRAAKSRLASGRDRLRASYRRLVTLAGRVTRQAERVTADLAAGRLAITGRVTPVLAAEAQLRHYAPVVRRVIAQTRARVFGGDIHYGDKVLSLFEEHTQAISKGKAHKPTEFGRGVRLDEVEHGLVSHYHIEADDPWDDRKQWLPAVSQHREIFGRAPTLATADRGFYTARNEQAARALGVARIALPKVGRLSDERAALQRLPWFRRALRWRAGIEARIANLKHRLGMVRAHYKGAPGFERWVGWSVIANNLVAIARVQSRRKTRSHARTH